MTNEKNLLIILVSLLTRTDCAGSTLRPYLSVSITGILSILFLSLGACTYQDRVAPIRLPDSSSNMVVVEKGLKISAFAYTNSKIAKKSFGFDTIKAGLLPVQVTFQNDGNRRIKIQPEQTFLVDLENNAWPVLSLDRTYQRVKGYVEVGETFTGAGKPAFLLGSAGAVAGLAVGIVSGTNIGESMGTGVAIGAASGAIIGGADTYAKTGKKIQEDLATKSLRNVAIQPKQIAYGVLFFPGFPADEAQSASELRLSLTLSNIPKTVIINLQTE